MRRTLATLALASACGPGTVAVVDDSTTGTDAVGSSEGAATSSTGSIDATGATIDSTGTPTTSGASASATTSTTDEGDAEGYEEDSGGTGCAFTCPAPPGGSGGGGGGVNIECDLWAQDCPEGEKCMPWANDGGVVWNATRCSPLDPDPGTHGDPCTVEGSGVSGIDDCDLAHMCWDVNPKDNTGRCVALCQGNEANPICPEDAACMAMYGVFSLCVASCAPLVQDCAPTDACAPTLGELVCAPAGPAGAGDPCTTELCSAGNVCLDGLFVPSCAALACCTAYCDPGGPPCPMNADCQPLADTPEVGVCVTP